VCAALGYCRQNIVASIKEDLLRTSGNFINVVICCSVWSDNVIEIAKKNNIKDAKLFQEHYVSIN
jgi:hypothetical protein